MKHYNINKLLHKRAFNNDSEKLYEKYKIEQEFVQDQRKILTGEYQLAEFAKDTAAGEIVAARASRNLLDVAEKRSGQTAADARNSRNAEGLKSLAQKFSADSQLTASALQLQQQYSKSLLKLSSTGSQLDKTAQLSQTAFTYDSKKLKTSLLNYNSQNNAKINKNLFDIQKLNNTLRFATLNAEADATGKAKEMQLLLDTISTSIEGLGLKYFDKVTGQLDNVKNTYETTIINRATELTNFERQLLQQDLANDVRGNAYLQDSIQNFIDQDFSVGKDSALTPDKDAGK